MSRSKDRGEQHKLDQDLYKLKQLLPGIGHSHKSKAEVIEEANRYIEKLHSHLVCQIRTHGFPDKLKSHAEKGWDYSSNDDIVKAIDSYARKKANS